MDTFARASIIWLSLQLAIAGAIITDLSYKLGYEQGRASIYREWASDPSDGTCYAKGGCDESRKSQRYTR